MSLSALPRSVTPAAATPAGVASFPPAPEILRPILASSELFTHIETLRARWDDEQVRRAEFRDRLAADEKAEFINGEIIVHSPARVLHNKVVARLVTLLKIWSVRHAPGAEVFVEKAMIACGRNDYEPDVLWYSPASAAALTGKMTILPPPDLAVEVLSPSTKARDRGVKKADYALNGVAEYWIIDADARTVARHHLPAGGGARAYGPAETGPGIVCRALPGLEFPAAALFDEDALTGVLRGLAAVA